MIAMHYFYFSSVDDQDFLIIIMVIKTVGSPKASTRPIWKKQRRCWTDSMH